MMRQAGFTLIELIMVIVILGVLSAFALPRFADLGGEARASAVNGLAGAMRAASAIAHAEALATNATGNITLEGATIAMASLYPTAAAGGIGSAAQIDASQWTVTAGTGAITYAATGAAGTCNVVYTEVTGGAPTIVVDDSGC